MSLDTKSSIPDAVGELQELQAIDRQEGAHLLKLTVAANVGEAASLGVMLWNMKAGAAVLAVSAALDIYATRKSSEQPGQ